MEAFSAFSMKRYKLRALSPASDSPEHAVHIDQKTINQLQTELAEQEIQYEKLAALKLTLDLTRGKPCAEQVALSGVLDGILAGNFVDSSGTDVRNYGGPFGIPEARSLFAEVLGSPMENTLVSGNSSLSLMYLTLDYAMNRGFGDSSWKDQGRVKFLCPVPGYDRHFAATEYLGIDMINVPITDTGPDMDAVEKLVAEDHSIKGIWCVPRFSNPTGSVYDEDTVKRIAKLSTISAPDFLVMWDNAYAVHNLSDSAPTLAPISQFCQQFGTADNVVQFGSTSKVTFAGAGVSFLASGVNTIASLSDHLSYSTIGPDKVNQLRHVRLLRDAAGIAAHMQQHAAIIAPRFAAVLQTLAQELSGSGMGEWTRPAGGYFISFESRPGLAAEIVELADNIGVKLTPAGSTFPYGRDPQDSNIRLSPTFPSLEEVQATAKAFVVCVKLASLRQKLANT
jgi:aspartate/methionine/tyrosine aminotransferase